MEDQEKYLSETPLIWGKKSIVLRGIKKMATELTSVKTLFLAFICVAGWFDKISDMWVIVGGLGTLGVKELPSEIFTVLIQKFTAGGTETPPVGKP